MGVAFTGEPIVFTGSDGSAPGPLVAGIHAALTAAGWTASAITGGYKFHFGSPQGLEAKLIVADRGYAWSGVKAVDVQFLSADEARPGVIHRLLCTQARTYEVIAAKCQVFVASAGVSDSPEGPQGWLHNAVCGGIPFVRENVVLCGGEPVDFSDVTEAWWSSGAPAWSLSGANWFRRSWHNDTPYWDACWNGAWIGGSGYDAKARLRLAVIANPDPDYPIYPSQQEVRWMDDIPLWFDPMLVWGAPVGRIRAQIWDAMRGSRDAPIDDEITTQEPTPEGQMVNVTWRNWMHYDGDMSKGAVGSYYSSLYLVKQTPDGIVRSNYAY